MLIIFLWMMLMMFSWIFIQMTHPLTIGMILLIQTFLTCLFTGMILNTFWFSYILFLIFIGGMMILFIYITSLASNEMFNFSFKIFIMLMMMMNMMIILWIIMDKSMFLPMFKFNDTKIFNNNLFFIYENSMNLNKLFNFPTNIVLLMLIIYLFITLILVVKITNIFFGPLRMMK
nr:NADH dehydrogenase subunit 6 [Dilophus febrilis]